MQEALRQCWYKPQGSGGAVYCCFEQSLEAEVLVFHLHNVQLETKPYTSLKNKKKNNYIRKAQRGIILKPQIFRKYNRTLQNSPSEQFTWKTPHCSFPTLPGRDIKRTSSLKCLGAAELFRCTRAWLFLTHLPKHVAACIEQHRDLSSLAILQGKQHGEYFPQHLKDVTPGVSLGGYPLLSGLTPGQRVQNS